MQSIIGSMSDLIVIIICEIYELLNQITTFNFVNLLSLSEIDYNLFKGKLAHIGHINALVFIVLSILTTVSCISMMMCFDMLISCIYSQCHTEFSLHVLISSEHFRQEIIRPIKKPPNNVTYIQISITDTQ